MLQGKELFADVAAAQSDSFWWLGQHSFIVKLAGKTLLIDPFLTPMDERNVPPLFAPADAAGVDLVLCTHDHLDHIDPVAVTGLASKTKAHFVAPKAHRDRMLSLEVPEDRLTVIDADEEALVAGLKVTAIKAAHEFFEQTAEGYYPYLGYVIEAAGKTIYHAGDTVWWEGLQARLAAWNFDVALVPINGRDAKRYAANIIGNMTYQEAADLLAGLQVKLAVPTHFDMFDMNREDPQLFVDFMAVKYPARRCWVGNVTERVGF
jgi:L-ascorbate metabolism protein UlaG (beta-lactamase superfamily)